MVAAIVLSTTVTVLVSAALVACAGLFGVTFTRWGRSRKMTRYAALSVGVHLMLLLIAGGVRYGSPAPGVEDAPPVRVRIVTRVPTAPVEAKPTDDAAVEEAPTPLDPPELTESEPETESAAPPVDVAASDPPEQQEPAPTEPDTQVVAPLPDESVASAEPPQPLPEPTPGDVPLEQPTSIAAQSPTPPAQATVASPALPAPDQSPVYEAAKPSERPAEAVMPSPAWQAAYSVRGQQQRRRLADRDGGDADTEDAVARGVDWLARAQRRDGAWDARRWGGGREDQVDDVNRNGAGKLAESGITGLALLALQGAGYTHLDGPYSNTITSGLAFLIDQQAIGGANDGDLAGAASPFARTYCHTMATFALAEAFAATGDDRLRNAVTRAVQFLERRQNPTYGGWRYQPGERGDMSQMGWAVMALRSAEIGGVAVRPQVWTGIERFVDSVAVGRSRGLACYRPGEKPTPTMTAEALYCRQILGVARARPAAGREAVTLIASQLPTTSGRRPPNLYYWYYGTLALHHQREASPEAEAAWSAWNGAMKRSLLPRQVVDGPNAGSWRPDTLWGGYGGRVYTTALATMCLEVYYRYDPDQIGRDPWIASRGTAPAGGDRGRNLWR